MTDIPLGPGAEFDLIRRFYHPDAATADLRFPDAVRVGPGDDCAVVRGEGVALSIDMSVEGVHFLREWLAPEEIGYRATAASLSDLAAMAATPIGVLVALAVNAHEAAELAPRIMDGARAAAAGVRAVLLGGDITRSRGPMTVGVVVIGNALRPILRRGARAGDSLWVTGELGAAASAVRAWKAGRAPDPAARLAFALPTPRTAEAVWLAARGAVDALIDISDGLGGEAAHISAASDVRIIIDAASVPIHPTVRAETPDSDEALRIALTGGEDYELCFAAPPGVVERIAESFTATFDVPLTCIGTVHEGSGVMLRAVGGAVTELHRAGFDHFHRPGP